MKKLLPLILIFSFSLATISCGGFFSASVLKQEIEAKIEYENSSSMNIRIMSDDGITSPSGDLTPKVTDRISLSFAPYTGLQFIKWQVIDRATGLPLSDEEVEETFEFENSALTDTSFKIKKWVSELWIKPLVAEKPSVLTNVPFYKPNGDFVNTTIKIIFDSNMDEGSIYYTGEELKSLGVELDKILHDALQNPDSIDSITTENRVYGYIGDDGEKHYKNISIIYKQTGENLLSHFQAPFFIAPDTLLIPVDNENLLTNNSTITASLKNFYYISNGSKIIMDTEFKWGYVVNATKDKHTPTVTGLSVKATSGTNGSMQDNLSAANSASALSLPDKILWIKGSVEDDWEDRRWVTLTSGAHNVVPIPTRYGSGIEQYFKIKLLNPVTQEAIYSRTIYYLGMHNVEYKVHAGEGDFEYTECATTIGLDKDSFRVLDFSDCEPGTYVFVLETYDCTNNVTRKYKKINIGG